jgi:hypothetical protein
MIKELVNLTSELLELREKNKDEIRSEVIKNIILRLTKMISIKLIIT